VVNKCTLDTLFHLRLYRTISIYVISLQTSSGEAATSTSNRLVGCWRRSGHSSSSSSSLRPSFEKQISGLRLALASSKSHRCQINDNCVATATCRTVERLITEKRVRAPASAAAATDDHAAPRCVWLIITADSNTKIHADQFFTQPNSRYRQNDPIQPTRYINLRT